MNNRLLNVGDRFKARYKRVDGFEFYGQILEIPDTSRVSNFLTARRYLRTKPNCPIKPSDVVNINGTLFIVGEHGTGFYVDPIYKHFKLFQVDNIANWYKLELTLDPITGVEKSSRVLQDGIIYLSLQPKGNVEDTIKIGQQTYTGITNAAVGRNDIVGNKIVTKVDQVLGCYLVELKDQ